MKINFTNKEYRLLLDMVEIAEWVLNAHKTASSDEIKKYSDLYQKILSYAKDMGFENLIIYDKNLDGYFATSEYEESEHMRYIEEFEDDVFWDALPHRLAVRDLVKEVGEKKYEEMEFVERATKLVELESIYYKELEENGIDNLRFENQSPSDMPDLH
jgi:L-rhamnose mutarotase